MRSLPLLAALVLAACCSLPKETIYETRSDVAGAQEEPRAIADEGGDIPAWVRGRDRVRVYRPFLEVTQ